MFKKFQLKNGLDVLLVESHKSPVVSVQMWVHTGSADERKGEEGISHFIEHLVFKGTRKFGVGEIAATVEGSGGELNAYTSFDQTVFYVTISKEFLDTGLEVISEMMGFPKFDAAEIDNEREVVIEEIKRGQDNPHRQASRQLFESIYKKHPYGIPVIGYDKVIRSISKKKIENYYHSRYVPDRMTLLLVGNFDPKTIRKQVEKHFGDFEPYKPDKRTRKKEPVQKQTRISVKETGFEESLFYAAWTGPNAKHKDIPALDVFSTILGQGDSSRLNQRMRLVEPVVNHIGASAFTPLDPGFFTVSASLNHKNLKRSLELLLEELEKVLTEPPTAAEMERALINFNSEEFYSLETVDGMARKYGTYEHLFGDYREFKKFVKSINQLTPKDILAVARKYLNPDKMTLALMTSGKKTEQEKHLKEFSKQFKKIYMKAKKVRAPAKSPRVKKFKFTQAQPDGKDISSKFFHLKTSGGTHVFVRPSFDTSVISIRAAGLGGLRAEAAEESGLTELLSRVWTAGTQKRSEQEVNEKVESAASSFGAFGGRNTAGLAMTTLAPFRKDMADLFFEALAEPRFGLEAIQREKQVMLEQIRSRKDNPAQQAIMGFMSHLFKNHPYSRDPLGSEESLKSLDAVHLKDLWGKIATQKNMYFVFAGAIDPDEALEMVENGVQSLRPGSRLDSRFNFSPPKSQDRNFQESTKEQSHIVYGFPGLTFTDKRRYTLQVLQSILAGQGGRLFIELRDKASLAYSVAPLRMEGIDAGYFGAYIGCSPEKGKVALKMMNEQFHRLVDEKVGESELKRAKRYLIGRHDIELQRTSAMAASILFDAVYDLPADESFRFADEIDKVSASDIQNLAKELFSQPEVISVVGPTKPW